MCQQIIQFCSGSARPLVFAGGSLLLLLSLAIAYIGHSTHSLYQDIDPAVAQSHSLSYYLQMGAALYLALVTVFSCLTIHYDHKQSIRALAVVSIINVILAVVSIVVLPPIAELDSKVAPRLKEAMLLYDFTDKFPVPNATVVELNSGNSRAVRMALDQASNSSQPRAQEAASGAAIKSEPLDKASATKLWDKLQARGCCGFKNYTEWTTHTNDKWLPKSCCPDPKVNGTFVECPRADPGHQQACWCVIESSHFHMVIVLALIALVNLYLSIVAGTNAYRTFHYDEASQGAYT